MPDRVLLRTESVDVVFCLFEGDKDIDFAHVSDEEGGNPTHDAATKPEHCWV